MAKPSLRTSGIYRWAGSHNRHRPDHQGRRSDRFDAGCLTYICLRQSDDAVAR